MRRGPARRWTAIRARSRPIQRNLFPAAPLPDRGRADRGIYVSVICSRAGAPARERCLESPPVPSRQPCQRFRADADGDGGPEVHTLRPVCPDPGSVCPQTHRPSTTRQRCSRLRTRVPTGRWQEHFIRFVHLREGQAQAASGGMTFLLRDPKQRGLAIPQSRRIISPNPRRQVNTGPIRRLPTGVRALWRTPTIFGVLVEMRLGVEEHVSGLNPLSWIHTKRLCRARPVAMGASTRDGRDKTFGRADRACA